MKIAQITPGAGGMYCGSCLNDSALAAAMIRQGHEVSLIPIYTPIRNEEEDVSVDRVFYGAVNVYLEQKSSLFRHTPWLVDRLFNSRPVLRWAASRSGTTDATKLGDMALSMLEGEDGNQRKELERLIAWLTRDLRPEIVHLSNSMLLGMARQIRERLNVPVVCSLQGEDLFLDQLEEPWRARVRETLERRAADVDGFIAPCRFYAERMAEFGLPRERMHVVPLGIHLEGMAPSAELAEPPPFVVGYLARICPEKGLHVLAEAFRELAEIAGKDTVRLAIAGWLGERDRPYCEGVLAQLEQWRLQDSVDYVGEVDRDGKLRFLRSIHVLSVPTVYQEPKGRFVLEALAHGVPVVEPSHGVFPELLDETGGGLLVEAGSSAAVAEALDRLRTDATLRRRLGQRGLEAVRRRHSDDAMASATLDVYRAGGKR